MKAALALIPILLLTGCLGFGESQDDDVEGLPPAPPGIPYAVSVEPQTGETLDGDVEPYLLSASQAAQQTDQEPASLLVLRHRAENDLPRLLTALKAQGYYQGKVDYRIDIDDKEARDAADEDAARDDSTTEEITTLLTGPSTQLVYEVTPGPRFVFGKRTIKVDGNPGRYDVPHAGKIGLKQGEPAVAQKVLDAEKLLIRSAEENGFAFAKISDREVTVDFDTHTMDVKLDLQLGKVIEFAEPTFTGTEGIDEHFLRDKIPYQTGADFDPRKLDRARENLVDTNLFSTVKVVRGTEVDATDRLPVEVELTQRKHRTIGAGLGYLSGDGPNARVYWEHRNSFGAGELLHFEAYGSRSTQEVSGRFRKPDIFIPDLALIGDVNIHTEDTDAYSSQSIGAGIGVERIFNKHITGTTGVSYRYAKIKENHKDDNTVGLISIPTSLAFDYSDNLLDPSDGWRLDVSGTPFWDTIGGTTKFFKTRATHTRYFKIRKNPRLIFATRGSIGSIVGADRDEIPADERFYAGGGGSIRGIPYQLAGDLQDGEPVGGRSVLEGSGEIRWSAFQSVELVTFFDAGSVFDSVTPTFDNNLQMGTGMGIRYLTPVGPLRLDVGVPVDRRHGIDDAFQFYLSIGQAY
ncbi:MAG: outer membrane protein assembly factor [Geminicoccaceae bacterium]|nr:outer membrane protein assembly factor [Geminicoccaceae bacterium]MCB9942641.1 outer membrane protein assembly factor [Geminicoccaceae bacterium]